MQSILENLANLLVHDPRIEPNSAHVRFLRFGASSLDLDVFAYVMARDWNHFLEIQGELLLRCMQNVQAAGAQIALQSPIYLLPNSAPSAKPANADHGEGTVTGIGNQGSPTQGTAGA